MADLPSLMEIGTNPDILLELLKNPTVEALLIIGITLVGVSVIMIYVARSVMPMTPFLYANAKIQASSGRFIDSEKAKELAEVDNLVELDNSLRESDYGQELEKIRKKDLRNIHMAVEKSFLNSLLELKEMSPKRFGNIVDSYLMFLEAGVLKTIYRAKLLGNELDESFVFSVGTIDSILLKHLMKAETVSDINVVMSSTKYKDVFSKKYETVQEFEIAIEEFVLNNFIETTRKTKVHEAAYIIEVFNQKVDIMNLLALIKFRIRGVEKEEQMKYVIKNHTRLADRFKDLIFAENFQDFVDATKTLPYYEALEKARLLYEKDGSMSHFENELYRYFKSFVESLEAAHTLGSYPLVSFIIKKEFEKRNLFVVSKGIDARLKSDQIKEMII